MISSEDARNSLTEAEATVRRSREAYGYSLSAPYCFIWGIAWVVGYLAQASRAPYLGWIWISVIGIGAIASARIGILQAGRGARSVKRIWLLFIVIYAFSFSIFTIFSPIHPYQVAAYFPLLWAGIYSGLGIWLGVRYIVVGIALGALTLLTFFYFREHFYLTMAFSGGGSLILTGFWLRKA